MSGLKQSGNLIFTNIVWIFFDAETVFARASFTFEDEHFEYDEDGYITLGLLRGAVVVIAHTERKEVVRIISRRKATKNEKKVYFKGFAD